MVVCHLERSEGSDCYVLVHVEYTYQYSATKFIDDRERLFVSISAYNLVHFRNQKFPGTIA
jgi:hypothetical protein